MPRAFHHCFSSIQKENCTSYIYSPDVYGDTSNCLKQTWKTDLGLNEKMKMTLTNVKKCIPIMINSLRKTSQVSVQFQHRLSPEKPTRLRVKDSHRRRMKDGSPSRPSQALASQCLDKCRKLGEINISALCRLSNHSDLSVNKPYLIWNTHTHAGRNLCWSASDVCLAEC